MLPLPPRTFIAALLLALLPACYRYVPVEPAASTPPMRVRMQISPRATAEFTPILGRERHTLEGELVERGTDGFHIEVSAGDGMAGERLRQRLIVAPADVLGIQRRELDRSRSYATAAGAAAVVGLLLQQALQGTSGSTPHETGGPYPPEARIPIAQLRFR
jgi:hypothetical protein